MVELLRVKSVVKGLFALKPVQSASLRIAARRAHGLVLVYHRVVDRDPGAAWRVVPAVGADTLQGHLQVLKKLGDVVSLSDMLLPQSGSRPRFAVTFDDDYSEHFTHALPVLRDADVPATFFVGGLRLGDAETYWWLRLEAVLRSRGRAAAAALVGCPDPGRLARWCESSRQAQKALTPYGGGGEELLLDAAGLRSLARGTGVTIGFHTVEHRLLPLLDDAALRRALSQGRAELEVLLGRRLLLFAYPHGKADNRVASATRAAGYAAGWTGRPMPAGPADDPYRLGRWEPGSVGTDAFASAVAVRLHRTAPL